MDSDISQIFDKLIDMKLIELLEMKQPNEAGKTDDPNYCKYHRHLGHPLEKCFVFKDKVMQLAREEKIVLDDKTTSSNKISITFGSLNLIQIYTSEKEQSLEPNKIQTNRDDDESWILMTRWRCNKASSRRESSKNPTRGRMVRRPRKKNLVTYPKKEKVEVHHYQKT